MTAMVSYPSRAKAVVRCLLPLCLLLLSLTAAADEQLQRPWTIYLVQHTHTDIGYTKPQTEILSEHLRYIDYAIDYCDLTKDYPDDARFRWTCEAAWAVSEYIRVRPAEQVARLRDCVRRGQIEVTAMYFNMAEVADENSLRYFLLPLQRLREADIPFSLAMQNDVNGAAWCLADYLADLGVRYLWMGEHTHRALEPFDMPTVFRWESPSGNSLYAFRAEHYMTANFWGIETGDMPRVEGNALQYLRSLEQRGYPFSEVGIQYSGYYTDNAPPSWKVCDFIARWNETHDNPKLRSATAHEFMDYVTAHYADSIKAYRTAYPDWWTDGFGSAARETGEARKAQADMLATQGLLAMASSMGLELPADINREIEDIHDNLLFYDEHTFGASMSITDPSCWQTHLQWGCKGSYAWTAQKKAQMLYETAGGLLQTVVNRGDTPTITFFNPVAWQRDAFCDIYIDYEIMPYGVPFAIVDEEGRAVSAQAHTHISEGRYFRIFVPQLPSLGYRTYRILIGDAAEAARKSAAENQPQPAAEAAFAATATTMENDYYRLVIDGERGGISSLYDKVAQREMVDAGSPWLVGQLIHEALPDREIMNQRTTHDMVRTPLSSVTVTAGADGPLYHSLVIQGQAPGLTEHGVSCEVRLYDRQPRVEFSFSMRPVADASPASYYVAFPFTGDQLAFDVQGGVVRPGENQLEGTASNWNTHQNFVAARSDGYQILLTAKETPLVQLGEMLDGPFQYIKSYDHAHVFSWVLNNYWTTNFRATQEGELRWHYTLTSCADDSDATALRFALGDRVQAYARVLPKVEGKASKQEKKNNATTANNADATRNADGRSARSTDATRNAVSTLSVDDDALLVTAISPARRKGYLILQVREVSGTEGHQLVLRRHGKTVRYDRVNALEEVMQPRLSHLTLEPHADIFVRIKK